MNANKVFIFDTTLRDGEQVPGCKLNTNEKIELALQLEELGVDIIEAGFPISSPGDFESVNEISKIIKEASVCALSRAVKKDIEVAAEALRFAKNPRIHTGIGTSDHHIKSKFNSTQKDILQRAIECVKWAKNFTDNVEFYAEDAGRTDNEYLAKVIEAVIKAGATTVNIPDTTGYCLPHQYGDKISFLKNNVPNIDRAIISCHCHNDLGLATANSIEGVVNGARQIECTINGLGERAGNTSLEEVAMIINKHKHLGLYTGIKAKNLFPVSKLVSEIMRMPVQPNKAIVGSNAFSHSSGIHQDGFLKNKLTYETIDPAEVGAEESKIILTARSGRSALAFRFKKLGFDYTRNDIDVLYEAFLKVADINKEVKEENLLLMAEQYNASLQKSPSPQTSTQVQVSTEAPSQSEGGQVFSNLKSQQDIIQSNVLSSPFGGQGASLGYEWADPSSYKLLKEFAIENRSKSTAAENLLWEIVKTKKLEGYKFRRQHIIGNYIADLVCLDRRLIIEIDGLIHQLPENNEADEIRTQWLNAQGFKVIRFTNYEVINETDKTLKTILKNLQEQQSIKSIGAEKSPSPQTPVQAQVSTEAPSRRKGGKNFSDFKTQQFSKESYILSSPFGAQGASSPQTSIQAHVSTKALPEGKGTECIPLNLKEHQFIKENNDLSSPFGGQGAGLSLFEKIWNKHLIKSLPDGPDVIYIDKHFIHEVTSPQAFAGIEKRGFKILRPKQIVATADHNVPTIEQHLPIKDQLSRLQVDKLIENCKNHDIELYGLGHPYQGIVHVIGPELGITQPGMTIVCGDSHTSTHGAFGSIAFGIGTSEVEMVFASQCLLQTRPKLMRININGELNKGVVSKDIILYIISKISTGGATGYFVEYAGSAIKNLSMEARMTICNMSIEMGARGGMIAPDETTFNYIKGRKFAPQGEEWNKKLSDWKKLYSDENAVFDKEINIDATDVEPMITYGTNPGLGIAINGLIPTTESIPGETERKNIMKALDYMGLQPGKKLLGMPVQNIFIGSCTNSRIEDMRLVASVIKGKRKSNSVKVMIVPGSQQVAMQIKTEGLDKIFEDAGFEIRQAGCSACLGMNEDKIPAGEYCISTSNRNFEGRQGAGARTLLASPLTAAASAITGVVTDIRSPLSPEGGT